MRSNITAIKSLNLCHVSSKCAKFKVQTQATSTHYIHAYPLAIEKSCDPCKAARFIMHQVVQYCGHDYSI